MPKKTSPTVKDAPRAAKKPRKASQPRRKEIVTQKRSSRAELVPGDKVRFVDEQGDLHSAVVVELFKHAGTQYANLRLAPLPGSVRPQIQGSVPLDLSGARVSFRPL